MQSKMTEREFKNRLSNLFETSDGTYQDDAAQVAREAGLEFAPEPVKLRAELAPSQDRPAIAPPDDFFLTKKERDAHYAAAVARYNAYPGLREAASQVLERAQNLVAKTYAGTVATPPWLRLRDSLAFLEAELAKGPK